MLNSVEKALSFPPLALSFLQNLRNKQRVKAQYKKAFSF